MRFIKSALKTFKYTYLTADYFYYLKLTTIPFSNCLFQQDNAVHHLTQPIRNSPREHANSSQAFHWPLRGQA